MIDKFVEKFEEFAGHEGLEDLTSEAKVILFGVYLDALRPSPKPAVTAAVASKPSGASKSNSRIRKPNRPATVKQRDFIEKLIRKGQLDEDVDASSLTVGEASALIDHGINSKPKPKLKPKPAPEPEPEPEPEGEYTGSYSHSSGGSTSEKAFWE